MGAILTFLRQRCLRHAKFSQDHFGLRRRVHFEDVSGNASLSAAKVQCLRRGERGFIPEEQSGFWEVLKSIESFGRITWQMSPAFADAAHVEPGPLPCK